MADVGAVLDAYARGAGYRQVARELAIPVPTVRNWLRGLRGRWRPIAAHFLPSTAAAIGDDAPLVAVSAIVAAADEAGWSSAPWEYASWRTNGTILTNTT